MRVVLDSNVFISALISPGSPPDAIYRAWRKKRFVLVTSDEQLAELRRASRYPKTTFLQWRMAVRPIFSLPVTQGTCCGFARSGVRAFSRPRLS